MMAESRRSGLRRQSVRGGGETDDRPSLPASGPPVPAPAPVLDDGIGRVAQAPQRSPGRRASRRHRRAARGSRRGEDEESDEDSKGRADGRPTAASRGRTCLRRLPGVEVCAAPNRSRRFRGRREVAGGPERSGRGTNGRWIPVFGKFSGQEAPRAGPPFVPRV